MQPLKSLTFVRIGQANSHKYTPNKKLLRAFKTTIKNINNSWKDCGIDNNILDWKDDKYWSYSKDIEYYKGKVAGQELLDYRDNQEDLLDEWCKYNRELMDSFNRLKHQSKASKFDSYHSPPQTRGLFAFPQYRLETFLTHWDETKIDVKHCNIGKPNESFRMRVKNFALINYNKPTIWCHFIEEAKELKVDIKVNNSWVLVNSCNYIKVLELWEKNRLKEHRNEFGIKYGLIKHCYKYGSKDDLEVFLVGV